MTALELIERNKKALPGVRYAISKSGAVIGYNNGDFEGFRPCAALTLLGTWAAIDRPILANGQPMVATGDRENEWRTI